MDDTNPWKEFVTDYDIPYRKATKKWSIEVNCPFCQDDTHYNLGLKTGGSSYGCHTSKSHGGRNPVRLIKALLGVPQEKAESISARYFSYISTFYEPDNSKHKSISVPEEFKKFEYQAIPVLKSTQLACTNYLRKRGLDPVYITQRFDLRWVMGGNLHGRIVVPIKERKEWYSFTARGIESTGIRYLASTDNPPGDFILDIDNLSGGDLLVVVEGPFDALKISQALMPGVGVTCLFGKNFSERQLEKLIVIGGFYQRIAVGLDFDATGSALSIIRKLNNFLPDVSLVRPLAKDWGEMDLDSIKQQIQAVQYQ